MVKQFLTGFSFNITISFLESHAGQFPTPSKSGLWVKHTPKNFPMDVL